MIGEPEPDSRIVMPWNLSSPLEANCRQTLSWSELRMLTQNLPARSILGQLDDDLAGKKAIRGGSSETDVNEPTTKPARPPSGSAAVTTQTPVGYWPRTSRNQRESEGLDLVIASLLSLEIEQTDGSVCYWDWSAPARGSTRIRRR
jgi:hypothetical protein